MRRLTALRPVLYMGRSYERGAVLPVCDPSMVAAWLRAGSAAWEGGDPVPEAPEHRGKRRRKGNP